MALHYKMYIILATNVHLFVKTCSHLMILNLSFINLDQLADLYLKVYIIFGITFKTVTHWLLFKPSGVFFVPQRCNVSVFFVAQRKH